MTDQILHRYDNAYPVRFDASPPQRYSRAQVVVRILLIFVASAILAKVIPMGLFALLYLALPVVAAVSIADRGAAGYHATVGTKVTTVLRWLFSMWAYLVFLTDRFPTRSDSLVELEVTPTGSPTAGSALLRILYGIPEALVLVLLGFVGYLLWMVQVVVTLISARCPRFLVNYQRGLLRWAARLFAYQASLVHRYPPFEMSTGPEPPRDLLGLV